MYELSEQRVVWSEKMVLKLGITIMAIAVFSGTNMTIKAYEPNAVLQGYIQENTMKKEQNDALFLLTKKWENELNKKYGKGKIQKIKEGIIHTSIIKHIGSRRIKINICEINREINPNIEVIPQLSNNKVHSKSRIKNIAANSNSVVAVNGTYFKQDTGTPLGALVIDGEIITGPIYERAALLIGSNKYKTARISFSGTLTDNNSEIKIDNINRPRMSKDEVLIYTSKWGERTPITKNPIKQVLIKDNKVELITGNSIKIPEGAQVITAPAYKTAGLKIGDEVTVSYNITPQDKDIQHIISGGPYLIKEGKIFIDTASQKLNAINGLNPRTAAGYTKDGIMILVTVDGRKEGSSGATLKELAAIMKELGCYEAINLDGGSSTVMYVSGTVKSGSNISNSAMISNALTVRIRA